MGMAIRTWYRGIRTRLVKCHENEELLKNKIVYSFSCKSAKELGPCSIKAGAQAFIGYEENFMFIYDPLNVTKPLEDADAKLFLDPSNELMISLLKHNSVSESYKRSQSHFKESLRKMLTSESLPGRGAYSWMLLWDMTHQIYEGDPEATF